MTSDPIVRVAEALKQVRACRIFYHKNPDGDAIGSSHALALAMEALGAEYQLLCESKTPDIYAELVGKMAMQTVNAADCVNIAVDSATPQRLGKYENERIDICIDHHEDNSIAAPVKHVETDSASCAEIVYRIILAMGMPVTKQMAELLYTGVLTDASCFRALSTRPETLMHAAQIAAHGVDVAKIARRHFLIKSDARRKIERTLQDHIRFFDDKKIAVSVLTLKDFEDAGITDAETEGLNELMDQIDGPKMAIVVREIAPNKNRISVRAVEGYSAVPVCEHFDGKGHAHAAGCVLKNCSPEGALAKVVRACAAYLRGETIVD